MLLLPLRFDIYSALNEGNTYISMWSDLSTSLWLVQPAVFDGFSPCVHWSSTQFMKAGHL